MVWQKQQPCGQPRLISIGPNFRWGAHQGGQSSRIEEGAPAGKANPAASRQGQPGDLLRRAAIQKRRDQFPEGFLPLPDNHDIAPRGDGAGGVTGGMRAAGDHHQPFAG